MTTEEKMLRTQFNNTYLQIEEVCWKNLDLMSKVIPDLERNLEKKKNESYSASSRKTIRQLDQTYAARKDELSRLKLRNMQIEKNLLGSVVDHKNLIAELIKLKAENELIKKKLKRGDEAISMRYDIDEFDDFSEDYSMVSCRECAEKKDKDHAGNAIQVIKRVTMRDQVNEYPFIDANNKLKTLFNEDDDESEMSDFGDNIKTIKTARKNRNTLNNNNT